MLHITFKLLYVMYNFINENITQEFIMFEKIENLWARFPRIRGFLVNIANLEKETKELKKNF